jgi:hypothetical protein
MELAEHLIPLDMLKQDEESKTTEKTAMLGIFQMVKK